MAPPGPPGPGRRPRPDWRTRPDWLEWEDPWGLVVTRGRRSLRQRLDRLRAKAWHVGQCAVAAGLAWLLASTVLGHPRPFFAPVAAVVALGTSYGQRLRRVAEVTVGVSTGVLLGDVLTRLIGTGSWQVGLIVLLAMSTALLVDAGNILVTQAAVQSVVVATVITAPNGAFLRWTDALIGGGVALVAATVVPRAPLRRPREQAALVVRRISGLLRAAAESLVADDPDRARDVLADARATDPLMQELRAAASEGLSVLASSPFRRRQRGRVRAMADLVGPLDFAMRNTRVLVRRVAVAVRREEHLGDAYPQLLRDLAACSDLVAEELSADRMATQAREPLLALARRSAQVRRSDELDAEVVLAQVRAIIADLLAVSGMDPLAATDAIPPRPG